MRAVRWNSSEQENWTAARTLQADRQGHPCDPSRCFRILGWTGGAAHASLRGSTRDRIAVAAHCCCRERAREVAGWGAFAFGLESGANFSSVRKGLDIRALFQTSSFADQ